MSESQTDKTLRMLKQAGSRGVTNFQFANARILRYGGFIHELRKDGEQIITSRDKLPNGRSTNVWRYTWVAPEPPKRRKRWGIL